MKRALVTGAAGFVGANLARRLLADGHDVLLVVGPGTNTWRLDGLETTLHQVDITDAGAVDELVAQSRPDWIFHLAAHGGYSWQTDLRRIATVNCLGAANLLHSALATGFEAFVNAGSSSEYGLKPSPAQEYEALDPNSAYGATKASVTMLLRQAALSQNLPITTLRLYSAYGPWEDPRRLIPQVVLCSLERRLPPLVNPATARDFVYINDVVEAFVDAACMRLEPGAIINIASGVQTTVGEVVETATRLFEIEEEPVWNSMRPRSWDTTSWVGNASRARAQLDWTATYSFEQGLRSTAEWASEVGWPSPLQLSPIGRV
jgi:UDP-glucose 4-epimerase